MLIEQSQSQELRKTQSISFRIDLDVVKDLQQQAHAREISLNVLVNQVLRRYSTWDRYENKMGIIPVPRNMLTCLMEKAVKIAKDNGITDIEPYKQELVKEAAETSSHILKDAALFIKKESQLCSALSLLKEYMQVSGIAADHKIEGGKHKFARQHDTGENWPLFIKELLTLIFERIAKTRVEAI